MDGSRRRRRFIATFGLERGDFGFLISDGEALWATGHDGAVLRIADRNPSLRRAS